MGEKRDPARNPVEQWVDDAGNWVAPPTPLSRAAYDAVGMALALEGLVVTTAAALVVATRWQLCRIRYSQWDRELGRVLSGGGRGHGSERGALMADVICRRRHQLGCVTA